MITAGSVLGKWLGLQFALNAVSTEPRSIAQENPISLGGNNVYPATVLAVDASNIYWINTAAGTSAPRSSSKRHAVRRIGGP